MVLPGEGSEPGEVVHLVDCIADVDDLGEALGEGHVTEMITDHNPTLTCTAITVIMSASGPP